MNSLKSKIIISMALILPVFHFLRMGSYGYAGIYLLTAIMIFFKHPIRFILSTLLLLVSFFVWLHTTNQLVIFRSLFHLPYLRLIIIMGTVILFNLLVFLYILSKDKTVSYELKKNKLPLFIFLSIFSILMVLRTKLTIKPLILDRFGLNLGNFEAFFLALYGAYLGDQFKNPKKHLVLRRKVWLLFSLVFFSQLFLGLFVSKQFLMTGKLHFPIPALIIGGPIYRGYGFFMIGLFLSTVILVGPAWCSHLCYVGGLDSFTSSIKKKSRIKLIRHLAFINLFLTISLAIIFKLIKPQLNILILFISIFGIISLVFIFILSPFWGKMSHCISWCPLGIVSCTLGKLNPLRIVINKNKCTSCGVCEIKCPYQAIYVKEKAKTNVFCTLCGDCIAICPHDAISMSILKKKNINARYIYLFLIIVLHTLFLGLARI